MTRLVNGILIASVSVAVIVGSVTNYKNGGDGTGLHYSTTSPYLSEGSHVTIVNESMIQICIWLYSCMCRDFLVAPSVCPPPLPPPGVFVLLYRRRT